MTFRLRCWWLLLVMLSAGACWAQDQVTTKVLESGLGDPVKMGEIAVVSYKLKLQDGTLIDSRNEAEPFEFELGSKNVIPGFTQAVVGMKVHERRSAVIPPSLGYGERSLGGIPPNSTLYYEIQLLQIKKAPQADEHGQGEYAQHYEGDGHDHGGDEENLSEKLRDKDYLKGRNAQTINKPAMFEFLIRDFFTKPWRYPNGYLKIWESTARVFGVLLLLVVLSVIGRRKGYWA